jgi:hypothetical protein
LVFIVDICNLGSSAISWRFGEVFIHSEVHNYF